MSFIKTFDENTYVSVNKRLKQFRSEYPEGRITTFRTESERGVSFRTVICKNLEDAREYSSTGLVPATGHSFLPDNIKGDKVEEFSETVSVGRALAMLGYDIERSIASSEEMKRFKDMKSSDDQIKESRRFVVNKKNEKP